MKPVSFKDTYIINPNHPIEYLPANGVIVSVAKKNGEDVTKENQKITIIAPRAASCMEHMLQNYEFLTPILGEAAKQIIVYKSTNGEPVMSLFAMKETATHTNTWNDVDINAVLADANAIIKQRDALIQQAKKQFCIKK